MKRVDRDALVHGLAYVGPGMLHYAVAAAVAVVCATTLHGAHLELNEVIAIEDTISIRKNSVDTRCTVIISPPGPRFGSPAVGHTAVGLVNPLYLEHGLAMSFRRWRPT